MSQLSLFPDQVFKDPIRLREFILAGKATISIRSEKSLKHYTYKIRKAKDADKWFVNRLGANNHYHYLGTIHGDGRFTKTQNSAQFTWIQESFHAFSWLWGYIHRGVMPLSVTVWHEGKCGMCGLPLTDPASIKNGYGPDCSKRRLNTGFMYDRNNA